MRLNQTMTLALIASLALIGSALAAPAPASASLSWHAGVSFQTGGLNFALGYFRPAGGHYSPYHQPAYYYQASRPLDYHGYSCTSACYRRDTSYYHHPSCPVVQRHFALNHFNPAPYWQRVVGISYRSPGYYGGPSYYYRPAYPDYRHSPPGHSKGHGRGHGKGHSCRHH